MPVVDAEAVRHPIPVVLEGTDHAVIVPVTPIRRVAGDRKREFARQPVAELAALIGRDCGACEDATGLALRFLDRAELAPVAFPLVIRKYLWVLPGATEPRAPLRS